jgi:DNA-binding HxlR family transcriptional regulator
MSIEFPYTDGMASYGQYCPLSKTLEIVGDRWTLLIVRELLTRGALRYSEIAAGMPGIATNLLARRLKELEAAGLIARESARGEKTIRFALTPRGAALRATVVEMGRWGAPLLADAPSADAFRMSWMSLGVEWFLRDSQPGAPRIAVQLHIGTESAVVESSGGGAFRLRSGVDAMPDAVLEGPAYLVSSVLFGSRALRTAQRQGLKFRGSDKALQRLVPRA